MADAQGKRGACVCGHSSYIKQKQSASFSEANCFGQELLYAYFPFSNSSPGSKGLKAILSSKNSSIAKEVGLGIRS
ncbi:MAG: hypothetical protein HC912_11545 [Saprospiraceae bacterium]|nr:hypothetical protein [Saprospiraceae bacterium]